jgi:hypothetical protein
MFRVDSPSRAVQPRSDTAEGALFGRAGQGPEMGSRRVSQLAKRTEVGEGSSGSREAESRAVRTFISPKAAGAPIHLHLPGVRKTS